MREIRLSGSEGGGTGNSTGSPYPYPTSMAGVVGAGHARDKNVHRDAGADSLPPWLNALIFRDASGVHFCALLLTHGVLFLSHRVKSLDRWILL